MKTLKITEPSAVIVKSNGDVKNIQFACTNCKRVTIWTNDFHLTRNHYYEMQCNECGNKMFEITA